MKASNLAAAMRILQVLELASLCLVPKRDAGRETESCVDARPKTMRETVAEEEHIFWMAFTLSAGWTAVREGEARLRHPASGR